MPSFSNTRRIHHSADEMYDLVADVEQYPQFLPLCEALVIKTRKEANGKTILTADMTVAYKIVRETYTSRVVLDKQARRVFVEYINGPFRHLDNRWTIRPVTETSRDVDFYIDYEFISRPLQMLMGTMFDRAFRKFSDAFAERADQVYGKSG
jgi:coenzyme Q-binding protein COQ10